MRRRHPRTVAPLLPGREGILNVLVFNEFELEGEESAGRGHTW